MPRSSGAVPGCGAEVPTSMSGNQGPRELSSTMDAYLSELLSYSLDRLKKVGEHELDAMHHVPSSPAFHVFEPGMRLA